MPEYIERSDAEKAIREYADIKHYNCDIITANCVLKAVSVLKEIPAADVVEVVHGKWIQGNTISQECSCCGFEIDDDVSYEMYVDCYTKPKFCPECGAKMDGERSESE